MRGCPRTFATKQDFLNGIESYPEETKAELRRLIAGRFEFVPTGELAEGEDGIEDESLATWEPPVDQNTRLFRPELMMLP